MSNHGEACIQSQHEGSGRVQTSVVKSVSILRPFAGSQESAAVSSVLLQRGALAKPARSDCHRRDRGCQRVQNGS